jgi:hypothetical protein
VGAGSGGGGRAGILAEAEAERAPQSDGGTDGRDDHDDAATV